MKNDKGFTLIEIITTIAITSILAAIAVPAVVSYIDDANEYQYSIATRSVYNAALIEQDKYRISTGLSLAQLYQANPDVVSQIVDQVNKNLDMDNLILNDLAYFPNAVASDSIDIPANSYLFGLYNGTTAIDALVTPGENIIMIKDDNVWTLVDNESQTPGTTDNTDTDDSNDNTSSDTDNSNTTGTGENNSDAQDPSTNQNSSNSQTSGGTTAQDNWIDTSKLASEFNSIKYQLVDNYDKDSSKKLTNAYQDYLLSQNGYVQSTTEEMAKVGYSTSFYWVPIVTPDKNNVFFAASYNSSDTDKVSTTIVCIDGKYYQYINTNDSNSSSSMIAINDDGSDYQDIVKAANVNDRSYLDKKQTKYWIRIR